MKDKENRIGFALSGVTTEEYAVIETNFPGKEAKIGIKMNFRFAVNNTQKMISAFSKFTFQSNEKEFIVVEGGCHFSIDPNDWNILLNESKTELVVPGDFLSHIATIAVGTTRGILHARLETTSFNIFYLPIVDLNAIAKDNLVFKLNE